MNDFRHKDAERHAGQSPYTCHRPELERLERRARKLESASLIAEVCVIAGWVILIIVTLSALIGGAL